MCASTSSLSLGPSTDACAAPRLGSREQCCGDPGAAVCPSSRSRLLGGLLEPPQAVSVPHVRSHVGEVGRCRLLPSPQGSTQSGVLTRPGDWVLNSRCQGGKWGGRPCGTRMVRERLLEGAGLELAPGGFVHQRLNQDATLSAGCAHSPWSQRESRFQKKMDPKAG